MKPYTAEERTALVEWLTPQIHELETACDEIPFGLYEDDAMQLQIMRIALASLTAVPVAVVVGKLGAGLKATCYEGAPRPVEGSKLYDASPVTDLVPGDLLVQFTRHRLLEIIVTGPDASGAEQNTLARIALAFYPPDGHEGDA